LLKKKSLDENNSSMVRNGFQKMVDLHGSI
jgi:hypothetical protein